MSLLSNHQIHTGGFVAGHPGNKIVKYEAAQQPEPLSFLLNVTSQREELEFCSQVAVYSRCRIVLKEAKPSLSFQPKKRRDKMLLLRPCSRSYHNVCEFIENSVCRFVREIPKRDRCIITAFGCTITFIVRISGKRSAVNRTDFFGCKLPVS